MENKKEKPTVTRAEKTDAAKKLVRTLLESSDFKSNDLIDEAAKRYAEQFESEDTPNSVKGRIGSVIDVMKKEGEIVQKEGMYALKREETTEKPKKKRPSKTAKAEQVEEAAQTETVEKPKKKRAVKKTKEENVETVEGKEKEEKTPLPVSPLQPIAPVAPITPTIAPEPVPKDTTEEKPKKRGRKPKAEKEESVPKTITTEEKEDTQITEKPIEEKKTEVVLEGTEKPQKDVVDMSFLFGNAKPVKRELPKREEPKRLAQTAESLTAKQAKPIQEKAEEKPIVKAEKRETPPKAAMPAAPKPLRKERVSVRKPARALTAEEKLKDTFLKRLHKLGGDYFEYYSVYLLERYSRMNGRRLESLRISGGDRDGGIDGEIEVTDRLGFKETIYIQAKNWDPDKGDERLWVVGETLLQQFIGACVCRQAKDGKQHCRGIFITTSRFTVEAKKILEETSDKFVGYDGNDLYETAKECGFGIIKKNGEWALDEELLAGEKAFFNMK